MIQTNPTTSEGVVLILQDRKGKILEVVSDIQLDVTICSTSNPTTTSYPSRPLWEYLRKLMVKSHE